jgi:uncharacterized protein YaaW (UPF0174 family)
MLYTAIDICNKLCRYVEQKQSDVLNARIVELQHEFDANVSLLCHILSDSANGMTSSHLAQLLARLQFNNYYPGTL